MNIIKTISCIIFLIFFIRYSAFADEARISAEMQKKFPYSKLLSVNKTAYLGLYEVVFEDQLVYTDEKMNYLFSGNIIDMHTMHNLTRSREREIYSTNFDNLPFDLAIKNVKGNGSRKLAVFTDPNCQYCKKLEKEMTGLTNATVYIFIYPILPGSDEKAKAIWCTPDRLNTWENHMLKGEAPETAQQCDTSALSRIAMEAKKLNINVTPTLLFEDGTVRPGIQTLELLEQNLAASSQPD